MRIIRACGTGTIPLGRQGENQATQILFPLVQEWRALYGPGTFQLLHQRKGDKDPYAVPISTDEQNVIWMVSATDLAVVGNGKCELTYIVNDTIAKSRIYATVAQSSMTEPGEAPEPWESWVEEVLQAGIQAKESADEASESATTATNAATQATAAEAAAETAKTAAEVAAEQAVTAVEEVVGLTVTAQGLPPGSDPTVTKTGGSGTPYNFDFGIPKGDTGRTAYESAVIGGYTGTEAQFNDALARAFDAEAYAIGKRGGIPVPSTDPTYHNNAKYYAGEAETASGTASTSAATATAAATSATTAKTAAETAQEEAERAEISAVQAKQGALAAGENARAYAESAEQSETGAETAKIAAETAKEEAESHAADARTSKTAAETAKNDAVAAKTGAEAAKDDAETAKSNAVIAKNDAVAAKNAAQTAETNAGNSATAAAGSAADAETAKSNAVIAKNDAVAAKNGAESARDLADGSAEDAEAWAVGKRGGVDVPSTDPAYNNSSKYHADESKSAKEDIEDSIDGVAQEATAQSALDKLTSIIGHLQTIVARHDEVRYYDVLPAQGTEGWTYITPDGTFHFHDGEYVQLSGSGDLNGFSLNLGADDEVILSYVDPDDETITDAITMPTLETVNSIILSLGDIVTSLAKIAGQEEQ